MRGRPARQKALIEAQAANMRAMGQRVNKSRIAREVHCNLRTVFRVLLGNSLA